MRILSWNVQGDRSQDKLEEFQAILDYWEKEDPITIICLQELAHDGELIPFLQSTEEWDIQVENEQENGGGRCSAICVKSDVFTIIENGTISLSEFWDLEGITSTPGRVPMWVKVQEAGDESEFLVYTWHATLGSRQSEDLENFSKVLNEQSGCPIILAGDLNKTAENLDGFFSDEWMGAFHHLDHILGKGKEITDPISSTASWSDHLPLSAQFS